MDKIGPTNNFSKEYFLKEYHSFRGIMCSTEYSVEQKLDGFKGLLYIYVDLDENMSEKDKELCDTAMNALNMELNMRLGIQETMQVITLLEECGVVLDNL